jgi:hypothetical protein
VLSSKYPRLYGPVAYRFGGAGRPFGQNGPYKQCEIRHLTLPFGRHRAIVTPAPIHYDRARSAFTTPS